MPEPDYVSGDYDPDAAPDPRMEIMGRGIGNRKSKTLLPNIELAVILGLVKEHIENLRQNFRAMHAAHFKVEVDVDPEDKSKGTHFVPEILSDQQIREKYNAVAKWEAFHQEQVDHYPSVGGFSTKAAMGYDEKQERKARQDSSAGTDRGSDRWG